MNATQLRRTVSTTARYLPGMYPNAPKRNIIVLITYALLLSVLAGVFHLLVEVWVGLVTIHGAVVTPTSRPSGLRKSNRPRTSRRPRHGT